MDNPYLDRGESIILTTHRISVDSALYDAILTTKRLILIDDQYTVFQPRSIMLLDIVSLRGGKLSSGDPLITLVLKSLERDQQPLHLVFSQQSGEARKEEREDWVKKIMELRVALHQQVIPVEISPISHEHGMHPSVRRGIAPEKIRPLKNISAPPEEPTPLVVIPDETTLSASGQSDEEEFSAKSVEAPDLFPVAWPVIPRTERESGEIPTAERCTTGETPEIAEGLPVIPASGQSDEEEFGAKSVEAPDLPVAWPVIPRTEPESGEIPTAERCITGETPEIAEGPVLPDFSILYEGVNVPFNAAERDDLHRINPHFSHESGSHSDLLEEKDQESESSESPVPNNKSAVAENPVDDRENPPIEFLRERQSPMETRESSPPESAACLPSSEGPSPQQNPNIFHGQGMPDSEEKSAQGVIAPTRYSQSLPTGRYPWKKIIVVGIILISILLLAGGAMIFSPLSYEDNSSHVVPPVNTTPTIQIKPTSLPILIPQSGLWVRVNFSGYYLGRLGNPDLLIPVSGTGDQLYKIQKSDGIVLVSVEKQDNSGNPLSVEIYKDSALVTSRRVTAPMGSIDLLIDSKTGYPPGIVVNATIAVSNYSDSAGRLEYY